MAQAVQAAVGRGLQVGQGDGAHGNRLLGDRAMGLGEEEGPHQFHALPEAQRGARQRVVETAFTMLGRLRVAGLGGRARGEGGHGKGSRQEKGQGRCD
ncbi:hypothetical protein D3C86_974430 [compost metagenome]